MVVVALAACLAVPAVSDQIRAADLAPASRAFAELDPAAVVGWAPAPGVQRVFPVAELRRIAARLRTPAVPETSLCVERKVAPLEPARVVAAIQPQVPEGAVRLLDFSRAPAPEGELVLPRSVVRRAAGNTYFWSGYVRYAGSRRFAVWARVAVDAAVPAVVAAADLRPGRAIRAADLRLETRSELLASGLVASLDQAVGKWPRRPIRAGTAVAAQWLQAAPEIVRGDAVKVDVRSGGAHLEMDARAESNGSLGERVAVRNPVSQMRFFGRVEGRGRVSAGPAQELP